MAEPAEDLLGLDNSSLIDARNRTFLALARAKVGSTAYLLRSQFDMVSGQFPSWVVLRQFQPAGTDSFGEPWLVAGDPWFETGAEFYITCRDEEGDHYAYLKSHDSGQTWVYDRICRFGNPADPVLATGPARPCVWRDDPQAPLFFAYLDDTGTPEAGYAGKIRFLRGTDMDVHVYFEPIYPTPPEAESAGEGFGDSGEDEITLPLWQVQVAPYLPGTLSNIGNTVPQVAAHSPPPPET